MAASARNTSAKPALALETRARPAVLRSVDKLSGTAADHFTVRTSHGDIAAWQSAGRKLPVLMIHGNSTCKEVFRAQMDSVVGQEHRLIAIDLPGHGDSTDAIDPARTYSMSGYADAIVEVIEALGLDRIAVVGWSLGGHVGLELMAAYPDLLGVMAIAAPPLVPSPAGIERAFKPNPDLLLLCQPQLNAAEMERFAQAALGPTAAVAFASAVKRTDGRTRALGFEALVTGRVADERSIAETNGSISLAIVNGACDPFVNADYLSGISFAKLWRNTCHVLPGSGHAPMLEVPHIFNTILSAFLSDMIDISTQKAGEPDVTYSG